MIAALAVAAAVAAGAPAAVPPDWKTCTSRQFGYSIQYPAGWHRDRHCAYFDPRPFTVPPNGDFTGTAIEVQVAQQSYAGIVRGMTDRRFARTVARRSAKVAGRRATIVETVATGEGLHERGTRIYAYVVDRGTKPPLILQSTRRPGLTWRARKAVLDRAARTLRLLY